MTIKATKKPVEVVRYTGDNLEEVQNFCGKSYVGYRVHDNAVCITYDYVFVPIGYYIIKDGEELFACEPNKFESTYYIEKETQNNDNHTN